MADISEQDTKTKELESRLIDVISNGIKQRTCTCDEEGTCYFLMDKIVKENLSSESLGAYKELICEKYPEVCELNIRKKQNE